MPSTNRLPFAVLLAAALLAAPASAAPEPAPAPADKPAKLVKNYFKARKDADRAAARAAIDAADPLDPDEVEDLAEDILDALAKRGRKVSPRGRNEWWGKTQVHPEQDMKETLWEGLYYANMKGRKGLVLGLHGGGAGSGDAGSAQGQFSGPISSLGYSGLFPEVLEKTEHGWTDPPQTERWVMELVKRARVSWGVDPDRVYVTGHSMGGYGTWTYGAIYADVFAGGAAFAGAPTVYWKSPALKDKEAEGVMDGILPNLYKLPLFVFQSLDDPQVPAAANVFACARLKELHEEDPAGWNFVYEEVDGLGHGFPKKGPTPGLQWMAQHPRDPRPTTILWQPVRPWKTTFYWIRWTEPWLGCELRAVRDPERNAVDITLKKTRGAEPLDEAGIEARIRTLSVLLDDRVLDCSKEVVVTVDGKVRFRGVPRFSLATLLRTCEDREDPGYAFAAEAPVGEVVGAAVGSGGDDEPR